MGEKVEIFVRSPTGDPVRAVVNRWDAVGTLFAEDPSYRIFFVFGDSVLHPAFSFDFHGIGNGDEITIVKEMLSDEELEEKWRLSEDGSQIKRLNASWGSLCEIFGYRSGLDAMRHAVEELFDPCLANEAAKLRDGYFRRIEGNALSQRRLLIRYGRAHEGSGHARKDSHLKLEGADSPSEGALPCLWKGRKKKGHK